MRVGVFDIESNGFVREMTDIWCIWVQDPITRRSVGYRPHEIDKAIKFLSTFDVLVGHNIVGFDFKAIKKLYPDFKPKGVFDTLTLSLMLYPDRKVHSLKSYGEQLQNLKGDYGEEENAWDQFSEEMFLYCQQDVELNCDVYDLLCNEADFDRENPPFLEGEYLV